jgi:hypothetical protein
MRPRPHAIARAATSRRPRHRPAHLPLQSVKAEPLHQGTRRESPRTTKATPTPALQPPALRLRRSRRAKPPGSAQPLCRPRPRVFPRMQTRTRRGIRRLSSSGRQGALCHCSSLKAERRLAVSEPVGASGSGGYRNTLQTGPVAARLRIGSPFRAQRVRNAPDGSSGTGRAAYVSSSIAHLQLRGPSRSQRLPAMSRKTAICP